MQTPTDTQPSINYHPLVRALTQGLRNRCLVKPEAHIVVACSGGADSVALLRALHAIRDRRGFECKLIVAHVHHHLRKDGSADLDEAFVSDLAQSLQLPYRKLDLNPDKRPLGKDMQNDEAWGRTARYAALTRIAVDVDAEHIATAHHTDDQIETLLIRISRGTTLKGLSGIAWDRPASTGAWDSSLKNPITIIRPLLAAGRDEILDFLKQLNQPYRTDPTNLDTDRTRAKIRQEVVPILKSLQPSLGRVVQKLCDEAAATAFQPPKDAPDQALAGS